MANLVEDLAERLLCIDWYGPVQQRKSQMALMREYLRRAAWWSKEIGGGWPFYDFAAVVAPDVRASPAVVRRLEEELPLDLSMQTIDAAVRALHFAALHDAHIPLPAIADPFEPLLMIFTRGSSIKLDKTKWIEVDGLSMPIKSRDDHLESQPCAPMDAVQLDAIDLK